jgi:hypothetical protein
MEAVKHQTAGKSAQAVSRTVTMSAAMNWPSRVPGDQTPLQRGRSTSRLRRSPPQPRDRLDRRMRTAGATSAAGRGRNPHNDWFRPWTAERATELDWFGMKLPRRCSTANSAIEPGCQGEKMGNPRKYSNRRPARARTALVASSDEFATPHYAEHDSLITECRSLDDQFHEAHQLHSQVQRRNTTVILKVLARLGQRKERQHLQYDHSSCGAVTMIRIKETLVSPSVEKATTLEGNPLSRPKLIAEGIRQPPPIGEVE